MNDAEQYARAAESLASVMGVSLEEAIDRMKAAGSGNPPEPEPCDATYYGEECDKTGAHVWHFVKYPNGTSVQWEGESLPRANYACAICGEPEGSDYARLCCENNVEMI